MVNYLENSNICDVTSGIILQGCNAQGVMGSGVAKQIRAKYPQVYPDYVKFLRSYDDLEVSPLGKISVTRVSTELLIYSGITQEFYGKDGRQYVDYDAMRDIFANTISDAVYYGLSVHIPYMIGAGLGGGNIKVICDMLEELSLGMEKDVNCHVFNK